LHLAVHFLPLRGEGAQKAAWRKLCRMIRDLGSGIIPGTVTSTRVAILQLTRVLVRFDHVARRILNANYSICEEL